MKFAAGAGRPRRDLSCTTRARKSSPAGSDFRPTKPARSIRCSTRASPGPVRSADSAPASASSDSWRRRAAHRLVPAKALQRRWAL